MNSVFDPSVREKLIQRIELLSESSQPAWGEMNVSQMLRHCIRCEELYLGRRHHKRAFLGRLIGPTALKNLMKDERPLRRNAPTSPAFIVKETAGDVNHEKEDWISLIREYSNFDQPYFVHWFFGKMTREELGRFVYKHTDHHLRQFQV
ncbi:MAG TPA: DinB family protein [Flavitalea sp.]|nr:DinB family protein [Flavitalea sp.]